MLDMWGQLNVEMDSLAKVDWKETSSSVLPFHPNSIFFWNLWIGKGKLTSWNRKAQSDNAKSTELLDHWTCCRNIPRLLIRDIDWEAGQLAIKQLSINKLLWIPKWLAGFAPVGKVLERNNLQIHAECHCCSAFETTARAVLCPAPNAQQQWDASIAELKIWLTKACTLPDYTKASLSRLQEWHNNKALTEPLYNWPGVNDLILTQDSRMAKFF
jgi:hypothetical protein